MSTMLSLFFFVKRAGDFRLTPYCVYTFTIYMYDACTLYPRAQQQ